MNGYKNESCISYLPVIGAGAGPCPAAGPTPGPGGGPGRRSGSSGRGHPGVLNKDQSVIEQRKRNIKINQYTLNP
jgi:hypothetical protein